MFCDQTLPPDEHECTTSKHKKTDSLEDNLNTLHIVHIVCSHAYAVSKHFGNAFDIHITKEAGYDWLTTHKKVPKEQKNMPFVAWPG